jgi:hypothetical protein
VIIANILTIAEHKIYDEYHSDNELVSEGLHLSEKVATRSLNKRLFKMNVAYAELNRRAATSGALFFAGKFTMADNTCGTVSL